MSKIILKGIKKKFDTTEVLKGVDIEIGDSSFTIILGPSGCGKSTLLRILSGLEKADEGSIVIADRDVTLAEPKDRKLAMVFQNYALYPHMTVYKNVEYSLKIKRVPKEARRKRVMEALRVVEMESQAEKLPNQLSGGQRQRVALARAIVKNPDAFLMDEPLSNLDAKLRSQMRHSILELHKQLNATFVYVTHDQTEAMTMGDNIILLNDGKVIQQGSPKEIYTNPNHIFVASFIGNPPANIVETDFGYVGIRPEDLHTREDYGDTVHIHASVNVYEPMGSDILYNVTTGIGKLLVKADNKWEDVPDSFQLKLAIDKIMFFDKVGNRIYNPEKEREGFIDILQSL